ncbi:hypothetical protein F2Q70_00012089 [Brassica cretica]|uniref:Uncharacterized protein n=1 Tax=Brassica cretica TaxID=69181 RepID=A0A8S9MBP2_BRACR|nr:hypothetical protein F2Q70_00012089 [Brassica cretica]
MLDGVYYPLRDDIDSLTTHMNALQKEMDTIQRHLDFQVEQSSSIDRRTRPSIDSDHTSLRGKLVTKKFLQDKLDEITFSQDLLKEDIYQELKDISESTHARLGMHQRNIGNLQNRMHVNEKKYEASIDSHTQPSIDNAIQPTIDNHLENGSTVVLRINETFALPEHCYPSFVVNTQPHTSIDYHYGDTINRHVDYSIGSWENDSHHESFAVDTSLPEMRSVEYDEDYPREKNIEYRGLAMEEEGGSRRPSEARAMDGHILNISREEIAEIISMNGSRNLLDTQNRAEDPPSVDEADAPSIDEADAPSIDDGQARAMDGRILNISREEIADIIAMNGSRNFLDTQNIAEDPPSIDEADAPSTEMRKKYGVISTVPEQDTYIKAEIEELVADIYRAMRTTYDYHSKRLDDIYYPFNNSISWLTTRTDDMKQDIAMIQEQHAVNGGALKSIAAHIQQSIDAHIRTSIDAQLASFEDRRQSFTYRLNGVYCPLHDDIYSLTTHMNALQQEIDTIQRLLDFQAEQPPSIDSDYTPLRGKLELKDISESTYARLGMHQRSIGNLQNRMHVIEVDKEILKNQWTRGDKAIRSFIGLKKQKNQKRPAETITQSSTDETKSTSFDITTPETIDRHFNVSIDIDIRNQYVFRFWRDLEENSDFGAFLETDYAASKRSAEISRGDFNKIG